MTASNVGSIAKRRAKTKVKSTVKQLLYSKFEGNTSTKWGLLQEQPTKAKYLEEKRAISSPDYTVIQSGLTVRVDCPWLGASPDGLVYDPTEDPPEGIIEIKNPYSVRNLTLREAATGKSGFCLEITKEKNCLQLKKNHDYYYQIQCTLFCTNRQWCDLVVRAKDMHTERLYFDKDFWKEALRKLKQFYFTAILPELASPLGALNIREPSEDLKNNWDKHLNISS